MPQASEWLREQWGGRDGIGEDKAVAFLRSRGFMLLPNFHWKAPTDPNRYHAGRFQFTSEEIGAMSFLIEEWDWGGLQTE